MCGLFGWNFRRRSHIEIGRREALAAVLACANELRGDKSWGVYAVAKDRPDGFIQRSAASITTAAGFCGYGRLPLVMAHTRAPTQGKVCEKNAHPFQVGKIILSHNGTIANSDDLDKKHGRSVRVDSQHLAMHLDEGKPMSEIEGYGAITWNNTDNPGRVFLCRMRQGSLAVYGVKQAGDTVGVVWSSDKEHLRNAIGAARLDSFPYEELKEGEVTYVEGGKLYTSDHKIIISSPTYYSRGWSDSDHWHEWGGSVGRGYRSPSQSFADSERGYYVSHVKDRWVWVTKGASGSIHSGGTGGSSRALYAGSGFARSTSDYDDEDRRGNKDDPSANSTGGNVTDLSSYYE